MLQLQQHKADLEALDLQVAIVTFETFQRAADYVDDVELDWPLLIDADCRLYRAYGMRRGSFCAVWGPQNWPAYFRIMARGRMPRRPHGDVHQLGGDVLTDPRGVVRLHRVGKGPADRPEIEELLQIVRDCGQRSA